jgi:integrase/recombinase XerD
VQTPSFGIFLASAFCRKCRMRHFRHRFALNTLIEWYRAGEDIGRRLPVLSTFLGHAHVADTYWYLSVHPELMGLATERLERRWGADS